MKKFWYAEEDEIKITDFIHEKRDSKIAKEKTFCKQCRQRLYKRSFDYYNKERRGKMGKYSENVNNFP